MSAVGGRKELFGTKSEEPRSRIPTINGTGKTGLKLAMSIKLGHVVFVI
jgi:hypothetical protein